jgi:D-alanyl-D-alanine carboxypeptidase
VAVLLDMVDDPRVGAEFRSSLAIAGTDGTLWRRLSDQPGRLRGKTGTVDGVHCLAGYMEAADGEIYAFAFLANDVRGGTGKVKGMHDRLARKIFEATWSPISMVETP